MQSPRHGEVPPGVNAILEPPESKVPRSEDAPEDGEAAPNVGMAATRGLKRDTVGEEDYGLDEDKCSAYLRALEVLMERG